MNPEMPRVPQPENPSEDSTSPTVPSEQVDSVIDLNTFPNRTDVHVSHQQLAFDDLETNEIYCTNCGKRTAPGGKGLLEKCTSDLLEDSPGLPGDAFTDPEYKAGPHESHKMMGDVCKVCNLNAKQDGDLIRQECIRDESDKEPSVKGRMDQIQDAVAEALKRVGDSVHKKFAELMKVGPDMEPQVKARMLVVLDFNTNRDKADSSPLHYEDTYVVSFKYILGYWKALISTTVSDGKYYEVTYNHLKKETYVDSYVKFRNQAYTDKDFFGLYDIEVDEDQPALEGL